MVEFASGSVVFISIAFYGIFPIFDLIIGQYIVKIIIAAIDTPFVYLGRKILSSNINKG